MDELAAAAAVVDMSVDDNAGEDFVQRGSCGAVGASDVAMTDAASTAADKENNNVHAVAGEGEAVAPKVAKRPAVVIRAR